LRNGENRKPCSEKQPFLSQSLKRAPGGGRLCRRHHQPTRSDSGSKGADDFPQSPADPVPNHCLPNPSRSHKPETCACVGIGKADAGNPDQPPMRDCSLRAHKRKVSRAAHPRRTRKAEKLRPGCAGRNELPHPSAGAVCVRVDGVARGSRALIWFSSGRESRTDACVCVWMAGRCVS